MVFRSLKLSKTSLIFDLPDAGDAKEWDWEFLGLGVM